MSPAEPDADFAGVAAAADPYYVIATSPRTGSSLLAEALAASGRAGRPDEFFDVVPANEAHWEKRFQITDGQAYIDRVVEASRTPNGVFGFKLHWHQIPAVRRRLIQAMPVPDRPDNRPVLDLLRQRFPGIRFVWLSRRNKVAQAISYYRAVDTKVWRVWKDGRSARSGPRKEAEYDRDAIEHYLRIALRMDKGWRMFLSHHKIPALTVVYEDFVASYQLTLDGVLNYLDLKPNGTVLPPPGLLRLADAESAEWERRFRAEPPRPKAPAPVVREPSPPDPEPALIAYDVGAATKTNLTTGMPTRPWMDATPKRFAYRCLPMVIANQWGWLIRLKHRVEVVWDGTDGMDALKITEIDAASPVAASHFGCGILTFQVGYVFRTPPGYNLHVRGPANWPKDGVSPLEGIVESDWTEATFTMNWKITRPHHPIVFETDEPVAMISPVRRGELEAFTPAIRPMAENTELHEGYKAWAASRSKFNTDLRAVDSDARKEGWQKHYVRGRTMKDERVPSHQTAIGLADFIDRR